MKVANCFRRDRDQQASKHMIGVIGAWFLAIEHKQVKKKNKKFPFVALGQVYFLHPCRNATESKPPDLRRRMNNLVVSLHKKGIYPRRVTNYMGNNRNPSKIPLMYA